MLSEAGIDASKVSVLDKGEMVKTEGEYLPWYWIGYGICMGRCVNMGTYPSKFVW